MISTNWNWWLINHYRQVNGDWWKQMKFHSKTTFKYVQSNELIFSLILVVVFHTWFIKIQFWIKNWIIIQVKFRKKITFHNLHFALIFRQSFSLIWRTIILEYSLTGQRWMVCFTFFFPTVDDCQLLTVKHQLSTVDCQETSFFFFHFQLKSLYSFTHWAVWWLSWMAF